MNFKKTVSIIILFLFLFTAAVTAANSTSKLKIKLNQRPFFLNPIQAANNSELIISQEIFDSLLIYDQKRELKNNLTKSWEINENSTVFKFKLKKNVYFHPYKIEGREVSLENREVTAEDWKWSFEYLSSVKNKSPYSDLFKKVKGYEKYRKGEIEEITGIRVKDKYNLEIELKKSNAPFIHNLAARAAAVLPQEAVLERNKDFSLFPVGTGAFKFQSFLNDKIILSKNNNYWKNRDQADNLPYLDFLEFNFNVYQDFASNYQNYDIYQLTTRDFSKYQQNNNSKAYKIKKLNNDTYYFLSFKYNDDYKNQKIKKKIQSSLEQKSFLKDLSSAKLGLLNKEKNNSFLSKIYNYRESNAAAVKIEQDLAIAVNNSEQNLKIANLLKEKLQPLKIKLNQYNWTEYLAELENDFTEQIFVMTVDYNNKFQFLAENFYSNSANNYFNYNNSRIDTLIDYIRLTKNKTKQKKAYQIIAEIIAEDNPFILIFQDLDNYLISAEIINNKPLQSQTDTFDFKYLNIK